MTVSVYRDETLEQLRTQIDRFVESEVLPHGGAWEAAGMVPRDLLKRMGELGFLGIRYPQKFGGADLDTMATVVLTEALSHSTFAGFNITVLVHTDMASPHLARFGTDDQLARYMPGVVSGELITAIGVTEAGAGSDVAGLRTRAERDGNGWMLNGTKMFITNGVHADIYLIAAKTDPDAKGSRGVSMFIVEKGTPGFSAGKQLDKMGWRCSDTAELVFEDCKLPADALLGEENRGFYAIMCRTSRTNASSWARWPRVRRNVRSI